MRRRWFETQRLQACSAVLCPQLFLLRPGPPPRAHSFFMRQAPEGSPRGDRQTSGHDSISSAAAGRPESDDTVTATASVGAEVWHGRKWSHEAKNGDAGCQKGRIDTQSRTHWSKNNTMCSHGTFLHFQIDFIWFCEWCSAAKNSPRRPRFSIQAAIRVV